MLLDALLGEYTLTHLRCRAFQTKPLAMSVERPPTLKIKHFFLLSEKSSNNPVLALEVYVYLSFEEQLVQHIFVPKADTTGLGKRVSAKAVVHELVNRVLAINPGSYMAEPVAWHKPSKESKDDSSDKNLSPYPTVNALRELAAKIRNPEPQEKKQAHVPVTPEQYITKISLFTRAANAYIFPNSEQNKGKHLADGNALFSWWVQILEKVLPETWKCTADLPGAEPAAVSRYLPKRWSRGHIFEKEALAIREIPLFPDDPKGRFLEHLVVEGRYRSVNVALFWEELGFRQEFRLGNVVGIIGCENVDPVAVGSSKMPGLSVSHKQYKKIVDFIKSEDYAAPDVSTMITLGLPEVFKQSGLEYEPERIVGTRQVAAKETKSAAPVNTLTAKRPAVNNLTGLVRKARK